MTAVALAVSTRWIVGSQLSKPAVPAVWYLLREQFRGVNVRAFLLLHNKQGNGVGVDERINTVHALTTMEDMDLHHTYPNLSLQRANLNYDVSLPFVTAE